MAGWKEDTDTGDVMVKHAFKTGFIATHFIMKTQHFSAFIGLTDIIHILLLYLLNTNLVWSFVQFFPFFLPSFLYFICLNRFCACFLTIPLIPSWSNSYIWYACIFILSCFYWIFERILWHPSLIDLVYWLSHAYNTPFKMGNFGAKITPPPPP